MRYIKYKIFVFAYIMMPYDEMYIDDSDENVPGSPDTQKKVMGSM